MAGIDSLVNSRADMFAANPQGLEQRYAMNQDLLDLLALQKLKKDKEAAQRSLQMQMQPQSGTVKDQLAGQVMDMTKQEVAASLAPGIQQMGQRMAAEQAQRAMSGGLPTQPAPNMVGMARGGIVGYAPGGDVELSEEPTSPFQRWWKKITAESAGLTGDPIADNIIASKRAAEAMTPEDRAVLEAVGEEYRNIRGRTGLMGLFYPQTDEERQAAVQSRAELLNRPPVGASPVSSAVATEAPAGGAEAAPTAPLYQATDKDIAAITETLPPLQRAEAAPTEPFRSRYADRLAALEGEKKDKLGALIDFLLAAGASGGTNLGATLMGGGSGLQAREARLKGEELGLLDLMSAEEEAQWKRGFDERRLASEVEQAGLERESRERIATETAEAAMKRVLAEANQDASAADIELNQVVFETVMNSNEYQRAKQDIEDKYKGGWFKDANPFQAQADITALFNDMFRTYKAQITGASALGGASAGGFSSSYE